MKNDIDIKAAVIGFLNIKARAIPLICKK